MFRRRSPLQTPVDDPPVRRDPTAAVDLVTELAEAGWSLPRGLPSDGPPRWTLVGTVASPTATPVDPSGMVVGDGWSLDWWIGGDDRWHIPAQEPAVRQRLVEDRPVVETSVRIPGGDAVARTYGIRSPRQVGDEWVVVEITNETPVPLALALVIRPFVADGVGEASSITVEPTGGGQGREEAHLVRVDGRPAVVLPRRPARSAAGNRATGDALTVVTGGAASPDLVSAACPDGLATLALVLPLAHTATIRVAIPVGEVEDDALVYPSVVPDAATVTSGWEVQSRGPRMEVPERRVAEAFARARTQVLLAHDGAAVRRDGHRTAELEPGATEVILGALDLLDRPADVGAVIAGWIERLAAPSVDVDAMFLTTVAHHAGLHRADALVDWMLPEVAAAVERIGRAVRKEGLGGLASRRRAGAGLSDAAGLLAQVGQPDAAHRVRVLADRVHAGLDRSDPVADLDHLREAAMCFAAGDDRGLVHLDAALVHAGPTGAWPGPGPGGRPIGQDLATSAALVTAVRNLLVADRPDGLALLPVHPEGWYGGGIELHDAPTSWGRISYAIRWHGTRPALLWELDPHPGVGPVVITVPSLDTGWSTTEHRGDALLGEVAPPATAENLVVVSEHPDIDPEMRRPGVAPDEPPAPLADGGSFS